MPEGIDALRRAGIVARWPFGMALTSWRYLWRVRALHRTEEAGSGDDRPPALPGDLVDDRVQGVADGAGPLFHRRYSIRVEDSPFTPEQLFARIAGDPNAAAPVEVAVFRKTSGEPGPMRRGDEYVVRMPGPWDGPVRVVDRTPTSFRLATLDGHLEAGQIEFRACREGPDVLRFEIESWARNGDWLSAVLYSRLRLAKEMQLHMWTHFCERVAKLAEGRLRGGITIHTRRVDADEIDAGRC
jgi:hypothetical protein